jgi:hypothetical protein
LTFIAQFCFADSRDILPVPPPGDVMLLFFRDEQSYHDPGDQGPSGSSGTTSTSPGP